MTIVKSLHFHCIFTVSPLLQFEYKGFMSEIAKGTHFTALLTTSYKDFMDNRELNCKHEVSGFGAAFSLPVSKIPVLIPHRIIRDASVALI